MLISDPRTTGLYRPYSTLDEPAILEARLRLLDTIVATLGGAVSTEPAELQAIGAATAAPGRVRPIFPIDAETSLESAAFLNGFLLRQADWGDTYAPGGIIHGHPSDQLAAVLALLDDPALEGRRVVELVDFSYRLWAAVYAAMPGLGQAGWDYTTVHALTVPVLAAVRYADDAERLSNAVLLSASGGMILGQVRSGDITSWKSGATGYALQRGLWCYRLGAAFTATPSTFDGTRGWNRLVAPLAGEALQPGPAVACVFGDVAVKAFPCFQVAQTAVACAIALQTELAGRVEQIRAISISLSEHNAEIANRPGRPRYPTSHGAADHHVPYCVAAALCDGTLTPASFHHEMLERADLRRLVELTTVQRGPGGLVEGHEEGCVVEITLGDGTQLRQARPHSDGVFTDLSAGQRVEQLRTVVEAKRRMLEQASGWQLDRVVQLIENLEGSNGAELLSRIRATLH